MFVQAMLPASLLLVACSATNNLRGANVTDSAPNVRGSTHEDTPVVGDSCYSCDLGHGKWEYYAGALDCICQSCLSGAHMVDMQCVADPMGTGSTYRLTNSYSDNKIACLDSSEKKSSDPDGAVVAQPCPLPATGCDGNKYPGYDRQSWVAEQTGYGVFRLTNSASGEKMCLDRHFEQEGMQVIMAPCDDHGGDEWQLVGFPYLKTAQLKNTRFGKPVCLAYLGDFRFDKPGSGDTVGATLCDDSDPKQLWTIGGC